jgi:hypothetical protein
MAVFINHFFISSSFGREGRHPTSQSGRSSDGEKGRKIEGLSRKERPILQRRHSFSIEGNRSEKI